MLIEWKGAGPLAVSDPRKQGNYKLAAVIVCTPGINRLDDEVWKGTKDKPGMKDNPAMKQLIKDGMLVVKREKDASDEEAEKSGHAKDLHDLSEADALSVIKKTYNVPLLEGWAETEKRGKIRRAAEKKITKLMIAKPKDEEDEDKEE